MNQAQLAVFKKKPVILWEPLPPDFVLPDDPVDNIDQTPLATALSEALAVAGMKTPNQLYTTNFGVCMKVAGRVAIKAPDWMYVPSVFPIPEGKVRRSYTPYREGHLPEIVMEFLSDNDGREYDDSPRPPYGKWYFYEQLLQVPWYVIFDPEASRLEVYQLKAGQYELQPPDKHGRVWISSLNLFLGIWRGIKPEEPQTTGWLRWWNPAGHLLLWREEQQQRERQQADIHAQRLQRDKEQAQRQLEWERQEKERERLEKEWEHLEKELAQQQLERERQEKEQAQQMKALAEQKLAHLLAQLQAQGIDVSGMTDTHYP